MATDFQVTYYQGLAEQAKAQPLKPVCQKCHWRMGGVDSWDGVSCKCGKRAAPSTARAQQIEANRQQAARIAGLTWGDVACAIRALGMPEASEDFTRVCRALHHVVDERGYDNAEELLQSLDIAAECAEELRMPELPSEREQADADAMDRAERAYEERRDECLPY